MSEDEVLFEAITLFGKKTRITKRYWNKIVSIKHRRDNMEKIRVIVDQEGNTLHVWFDDPAKEHVCEETGDEVILIKDIDGKVIGFEKLNFIMPSKPQLPVVETEIV